MRTESRQHRHDRGHVVRAADDSEHAGQAARLQLALREDRPAHTHH